jgi:hypothetical protein
MRLTLRRLRTFAAIQGKPVPSRIIVAGSATIVGDMEVWVIVPGPVIMSIRPLICCATIRALMNWSGASGLSTGHPKAIQRR